jgi:hypothetical protein
MLSVFSPTPYLFLSLLLKMKHQRETKPFVTCGLTRFAHVGGGKRWRLEMVNIRKRNVAIGQAFAYDFFVVR